MKGHLMPLPLGSSKHSKLHSNNSNTTTSGNSNSSPAASASSTSPAAASGGVSDRAKIAMLKSDLNLVQGEIDAHRGDPGGFLELQPVLDKFQWSIDPLATSQARDQLNTILLRKLNELANLSHAISAGNCSAGGALKVQSVSSIALTPLNSLVGDVVGYFQLRRQQRHHHNANSNNITAPNFTPAAAAPPSPPMIAAARHSLNTIQPNVISPASVNLADRGGDALHEFSHHLVAAAGADDPTDDLNIGRPAAPLRGNRDVDRGGGSRTPPSPIEILPELDEGQGFDGYDEDDGVSWSPAQVSNGATKPPLRSGGNAAKNTPQKAQHTSSHNNTSSSVASVSLFKNANANNNGETSGESTSAQVKKLTRQLDQVKLQLRFFQGFERQMLILHSVTEQLTLMAASPAVESLHTSLQKAVEVYYPQGAAQASAAIAAAAASFNKAVVPPGSPAGKKGKHGDSMSAAVVSGGSDQNSPAAIAAAALAQCLAAPIDDKKLRMAIAFQNAVIENLTTSITAKGKEDAATIEELKGQIAAMQKKLQAQQEIVQRDRFVANTQLERVGNYLRLGSAGGQLMAAPGLGAPSWLTSSGIGNVPVGGLASRPLSRASVADSGGLVPFSNKQNVTTTALIQDGGHKRPGSTFSVVDIKDHGDTIFGMSSRPASTMERAAPIPVKGNSNANHSTLSHTLPLVATRAEDVEGEKERRYLHVIRTQSDIIKDLSSKVSLSKNNAMQQSTKLNDE